MADPAKYLVVRPPSVIVQGLGSVEPGESFAAPSGYVPSRFLRALNQEAVDALRKVKAALEVEDAARNAHLKKFAERTGHPETSVDRAKDVNLAIWVPPAEAPKVERVVSVDQLDRLDAERPKRTDLGDGGHVPTGKKRTADG